MSCVPYLYSCIILKPPSDVIHRAAVPQQISATRRIVWKAARNGLNNIVDNINSNIIDSIQTKLFTCVPSSVSTQVLASSKEGHPFPPLMHSHTASGIWKKEKFANNHQTDCIDTCSPVVVSYDSTMSSTVGHPFLSTGRNSEKENAQEPHAENKLGFH